MNRTKKSLRQKLAMALSVVNALNVCAPVVLPYVNVARNVRAEGGNAEPLSDVLARAFYGTAQAEYTDPVENKSVFGETVAGGTQNVNSGGTAHNTTINSGGVQNVNNGGYTNITSVNNGGVQNVSSGGTANGTTVKSGGKQTVEAGGVLDGTQTIEMGGIASGGTLIGVQNVAGTATDITVNSGG